MHAQTGKYLFTCLLWVTGIVFAQNLRGQPAEILNQVENFNAATSQLVFNGSYTCSGTLVNNTRDQGRPLIITAAHCLQNKKSLETVVVIFGKRKLLKDQPYRGLEWASTGVSLLSSSKDIDFALLELNSRIPDHVAPVFLGWSKLLSQPSLIYSIHFPDFENAQYSFSIAKPSLATFGGLYTGVDFGHWKVDQWAQGTTTLGSSGAPLLNSNFEIIGGLSGSTDWKNYKSDYFFRFDFAYDHFSDASRQLKNWIDPGNSGGVGSYQPVQKIRNYTYSSTVLETVTLANDAMISEDFNLDDSSQLNGVYISAGKIDNCPGSIVKIVLSQNGSQLSSAEIDACELSQYSENYIPLETRPLLSNDFSVSLKFQSTDASALITVPRTVTSGQTGYFLALNAGRPSG